MHDRTWLDHTVYRVHYNERTGECEAMLLLPTSQEPQFFPGEETAARLEEKLRAIYGESAVRLPDDQFRREEERRITHSAEMLALLRDNWTGQDLSGWHVYGSILRPMMGIRIEGTVYLNGNGARYHNRQMIYEYVVARSPLDARTLEHFTLVLVSHP